MAARSNQAGCTTDAEKSFCCVTTRRRAEPFRPTETRRPVAAWERAGGDLVLPRRASDGPRAPPAALAAASLPASDAPPAGKRDPGNTAGSTAVPDRAVHSLWPGKFANPAVPPWSNHPRRRYAVNDPWEVLLPWGSPGRMFVHPPRALPAGALYRPQSPSGDAFPHATPSAKEREIPRKVDMMLPIDRAVVNRPEGDQEGHVPDMRGLEEDLGRRQARRKEDYRTALRRCGRPPARKCRRFQARTQGWLDLLIHYPIPLEAWTIVESTIRMNRTHYGNGTTEQWAYGFDHATLTFQIAGITQQTNDPPLDLDAIKSALNGNVQEEHLTELRSLICGQYGGIVHILQHKVDIQIDAKGAESRDLVIQRIPTWSARSERRWQRTAFTRHVVSHRNPVAGVSDMIIVAEDDDGKYERLRKVLVQPKHIRCNNWRDF